MSKVEGGSTSSNRVEDLFERLRSRGEIELQEWRNERKIETVSLECKRKRNPTNGDFDRDDIKNLAECLSAFANSMGGILIFGISAAKNSDEIDCVTELVPIRDIDVFESRAQSLIGGLLAPRHDGIEILKIYSRDQDGCGYLALKVDRSERRPHRCEAAGSKAYFKRIGDSSHAMEHYDIEDAFTRRQSAWLDASHQFVKGGQGGRQFYYNIELYLENNSTKTARDLFLDLRGPANLSVNEPDMQVYSPMIHVRELEHDGWLSFQIRSDLPLHPRKKIFGARVIIRAILTDSGGVLIGGMPYDEAQIKIDCRFGCEDSIERIYSINYSNNQLLSEICRCNLPNWNVLLDWRRRNP